MDLRSIKILDVHYWARPLCFPPPEIIFISYAFNHTYSVSDNSEDGLNVLRLAAVSITHNAQAHCLQSNWPRVERMVYMTSLEHALKNFGIHRPDIHATGLFVFKVVALMILYYVARFFWRHVYKWFCSENDTIHESRTATIRDDQQAVTVIDCLLACLILFVLVVLPMYCFVMILWRDGIHVNWFHWHPQIFGRMIILFIYTFIASFFDIYIVPDAIKYAATQQIKTRNKSKISYAIKHVITDWDSLKVKFAVTLVFASAMLTALLFWR